MKPTGAADPATQEEVRAQLQRILAHSMFSGSKRLSSLLTWVVERTLDGHAEELKEYTLGVEVFGRGTQFDPRLDSIVRVEASKLRSRLASYYQDAGVSDPVRIELTRGSYVPVFSRNQPPQPRQSSAGSIAVLPFVNHSLEEEGEYFADGVTEEVINRLGTIAGLRIVSRTSSFQFKGKAGDIQEIGSRLGVTHLIEGSVRKSGERLRVTAQLIEVCSGYQLWSQAWDETLADVFAIQKAIAYGIGVALGQTLTPARSSQSRPASMEAYRAYLRARFHRNQWTMEGAVKSVEYFRKALEYEPEYPQALAALSEAYTLRAVAAGGVPGPYFELAREAALRALALTDDSAQAHLSLAWIYHVYDWEWEKGDAEVRRALQLEPGLAGAHHLDGILRALRGRFREASEAFANAIRCDPLSPVINTHAALVPYCAREFSAAEQQVRTALALEPNFLEAHWMLGWIYERQGRFEQALTEVQIAMQVSEEHPGLIADKACLLALMGETASAREMLARIADGGGSHPMPTMIAKLCLLLGHTEDATVWLCRAFEAKDTLLAWSCGDPRFEQLWALPAIRSFRQRFLASASVSG